MGAVADTMPSAGYVDFKAVSSAAQAALDMIVPRILPGGYRKGCEWIVRNPTRNDATTGSFSVNLQTGVWGDFATRETGGDLIDLVAYLRNKSKVEAARELGYMLNVPLGQGSTSLTGNIRSAPPRKPSAIAAKPAEARVAPTTFPARTVPDKDGKPRFIVAGDEGPRVRENEKRRHVYCRGGVPVRIKIMLRDGDAFNVFRVGDVGCVTGWQYRKPDGFQSVPYFADPDPFNMDGPIYWPEGEKDVETLAKGGLPAFTFGGTGDGIPAGCEEYVRGRHVVILADNDTPGREHAQEKAGMVTSVAASVKVIHFSEMANKQDVSDWIEAGHTIDELKVRAEAAEIWQPEAVTLAEQSGEGDHAEQQIERRAEQKLSLPHGYSFSDRGLMWSNPDDLDKPAILIAGHFDIVAETRDGDGASWGVLLHWKDHDNRDHQFALPRSTLAGDGSEARRILMDGGFFIAPSQTARACSIRSCCRSSRRIAREQPSALAGTAIHSCCRTIVSGWMRETLCFCRVRQRTNTRFVNLAICKAGSKMLPAMR